MGDIAQFPPTPYNKEVIMIAKVLEVLANLNLAEWIAAVNALLVSLISIFLMIPGEQPEKALKGIANLLGLVSKK